MENWKKILKFAQTEEGRKFSNLTLTCKNQQRLEGHAFILASLVSEPIRDALLDSFQDQIHLILPEFEPETVQHWLHLPLADDLHHSDPEKNQLIDAFGTFAARNQVQQRFKCPSCQKSFFSSETSLERHVKVCRIHANPNECQECGLCRLQMGLTPSQLVFAEEKSLKYPQRSPPSQNQKVPLDHNSEKAKTKARKIFQCRSCDKILKTNFSLKVHENSQHKMNKENHRFECSSCGKSFKQKSHLTVHNRIHTGEKNHMCSICGKKFSVGSNLNQHMKFHEENEHKLKKEECPAATKNKVYVTDLIYQSEKKFLEPETVEDNKKHACQECGRRFKSSSTLKKHMMLHSNERPFSCDLCEKTFIQRVHLETHRLSHTGERPFLCGECGKSFVTKSALGEHSKSHFGLKKTYKCEQCDKSYINSADLKIHLRHHSGLSPFKCEHCDKKFKAKRHLEDHIRIHRGQKPFSCSNCNKNFVSAGSLGLHFKRNDFCRLTSSPRAFCIKNPPSMHKEPSFKMKKDEKSRSNSNEEKRFVQMAPEAVQNLAESIGIANLDPNISRALSEDVSYRARELTHICAQFMRHCKRKTMTTEDMALALKWYSANPVYGVGTSDDGDMSDDFHYVNEADVYVPEEEFVNLAQVALEEDPEPLNLQPSLSASWLSIEGIPLTGNEDGKVVEFPQQSQLSPNMKKYFSAVTSTLIDENDKLFQVVTMVIQDVKINSKISPLLPLLINFVRSGMQRHPDKRLIPRLLQLLQALLSNHHLNLSPKPYLSHLVTALLSSLIPDRPGRTDSSARNLDFGKNWRMTLSENVPMASLILTHVLRKWATPTNQLKFQTQRALSDCLKDWSIQTSGSHYGAIYAMISLGPDILEESLVPILDKYSSNLIRNWCITSDESHKVIINTLLGTLTRAVRSILHQKTTKLKNVQISEDFVKTYRMMAEHFGDTLAMVPLPVLSKPTIPSKEFVGKLKIRFLGTKNQNLKYLPSSPPRKRLKRDDFLNFHTLADIEVPNDIFETSDHQPSSFNPRYIQTRPDTTPKKLSPLVLSCFESLAQNKNITVMRYKNMKINFGNPWNKDQLKRAQFQVQMRLHDPNQSFFFVVPFRAKRTNSHYTKTRPRSTRHVSCDLKSLI